MTQKQKVLVILGPTASGKSDLAIKLARLFCGELISADSRQVYKGMDIATAKTKPPRGIYQRLVSIVEPSQTYSAQCFKEDAEQAILDIYKKKRLPIIVGGTAMFIDALVQNWQLPRVLPNNKLRQTLEKNFEQNGIEYLVKKLEQLDPLALNSVDIKNPRRVIRAIEVASMSGNWLKKAHQRGEAKYDVLKLGISIDRDELRKRINKRVRVMMRNGLVDEARRLLKKYDATLPSMSGIGYPEVIGYMQKEISKDACIEKIVAHTYQYARRQMTWWKRDREINWIKNFAEADNLIRSWLRS